MLKLFLDQSLITYSGLFEEPVFSLWKRDKVDMVEALYKVFRPYDIAVSDITVIRDDEDIDKESITVSVKNMGDYALSISGIECTADESTFDDYKRFLEVLKHADNWLRLSAAKLEYRVHLFELGGHGKFQGFTNAQDYLRTFSGTSRKRIQSLNPDAMLADGLILNWVDATTGGRCRLELDHSLDISEGLFFRWLLMLGKDDFAFEQVGMHSLGVLNQVLADLGLEVEENI